jgi:hypothetical protein
MLEIGKDLLNLFGEVNRPEMRDQSRKEAVDLFADIMKDFFQYVTVNDREWRSVEVEVPANFDAVLAFVPYGKCRNITFRDTILLASYDADGWMLEDYPEAEEVTITHWMPLPDDPKEAEA